MCVLNFYGFIYSIHCRLIENVGAAKSKLFLMNFIIVYTKIKNLLYNGTIMANKEENLVHENYLKNYNNHSLMLIKRERNKPKLRIRTKMKRKHRCQVRQSKMKRGC